MNVDSHVDRALEAEKHHQSSRGEAAKRVLVARRHEQAAHHDEGKNRGDQEARENTEFLSRNGEDEIGMGIWKYALDGSFARPLAEPSAGQEAVERGIHLKRIGHAAASAGIDKFENPGAYMRHQFIGKQRAAQANSANAGHPEPMLTGDDEKRRPDQRDK